MKFRFFFLQDLQCVDYPSGYERLLMSLNVRAGKAVSSTKTAVLKPRTIQSDSEKNKTSEEDERQVQLVLEGNFNEFNETRKEDLISVLASILKVDSESIRVLQVYSGSVIAVVKMPKIASERLVKLALSKDFRLKAKGILSIKVENELAILLSAKEADYSDNTLTTSGKGFINRKLIPNIMIVIGIVLLISSVILWIVSNANPSPHNLGLSVTDWITLFTAILGLGASAKGWIDLFAKDKPTSSTTQINVKSGNPQIATGENARNIQAQTYIEKMVIVQSSTNLPRSLNQLPHPPADFTGREREIDQILSGIEDHIGANISGLTGLGGIGKTALGLCIAHKIADKYPDGQIFLDLKGTTSPLSPLEIMRYIISSFEPNANLGDIDEKGITAVYQSILHNKKVLLFLDNARSTEQVEPLIPPTSGFLIITSRWVFNMPGLRSYSLNVLTENDARDFLLALCPRVKNKATEIAQACGFLPLALRIAGSFLQVNGNWSVEKYLVLLSDPKRRMGIIENSREQIDLGKEPSLIATFGLSYQQLERNEQGYWQMLSTFQHSFNWQDVAALWEMDEEATIKLLGLFRRYSLIEYYESTNTFRLHDFLADYGLRLIEQGIVTAKTNGNSRDELKWVILSALASKNASEFNNAIEQYKKALPIARGLGDRQIEAIILNGLGVLYREIGEHHLAIESHESALGVAQEIGNDHNMLGAYSGLGNEYEISGESSRSMEFKEKALILARKIGDRKFEAKLLNNLGNSYEDFDPKRAIEIFEQALEIAQDIGDRLTEGNILTNAGIAYYEIDNCDKAIEFQKRAQSIFEEINDLDGVGAALSNAGNCYLDLGQVSQAIDCYEKLLEISKQTYYRNGEANALGNLGRAYLISGELDKAQKYLEAQLKIAREISDRAGEGSSLNEIGDIYTTRNQPDLAITYIEQALLIFREIGDKSGEGYALWSLGKANKGKGDLELAKLFGDQALEIFQSISSRHIPKIQNWLSSLEVK